MEYSSSSLQGLLLITCAIVGTHSGAINRELDFLLTEDTSQFYGVSPAKDEYAVIHVGDSISRKRRSSTSPEVTQVSFEAFGEDFRIELRPNGALIAPGLHAKYVDEKGNVTRRREIVSQGCHYIGDVVSHGRADETLAAMSLCDGLSGLVATREHNLYILPLREDHREEYSRRTGHDDSDYRPHLVYRRDASHAAGTEDDEGYFCGLDKDHFHPSHPEFLDPPDEPPPPAGTGEGPLRRKKRQTVAKHLEVMVTVDRRMAERRREAVPDVAEYALHILNMAAARFQDESIGDTPLIIHVVGVTVLSSDTVDYQGGTLDVSMDAESTLTTFCSYQHSVNPPSDVTDSGHWDLAVLLTGKDVELGGLSGLVGIAFHHGTCDLPRQCLLVEDYGIAAGLIVAHEIGHTLGMNHDDSPGCPDGRNLMAKNRINGPGTFKWSQCSRNQYEGFITQNMCLNDIPPDDDPSIRRIYPIPLGSLYMYDPGRQCKLYSPSTEHACTEYQLSQIGRKLNDTCKILHCVRDGECIPTPLPSLDGTRCGNNGEVCMEGICLPGNVQPGVIGVQPSVPRQPVDGGWSHWVYPECSRTCGGGVQIQYRLCNNPEPAFGGAPCVGESVRHRLCRTEACSVSQQDYKNEQCITTYGQGFTALETSGAASDLACKINCISYPTNITRGHGFYANGTMCGGEYDRCFKGSCETFGCDGVLSSGYALDICGVCGGTGQSCKREGSYTHGFPGGYWFHCCLLGYGWVHHHEQSSQFAFAINLDSSVQSVSLVAVTVLKFALDTAGIEILSWNTATSIALSVDGNLVLDGRQESAGQMRKYTYVGNTIFYTKTAQLENITIPRPTSAPFALKVMVPGDPQNPKDAPTPFIVYEYYSRVVIPVTNYVWQSLPTEECTCGRDFVINDVTCILLETDSAVDDIFCNSATRPQPSFVPCERYRWALQGQFGACNATCGSDSYRSLHALCVRAADTSIAAGPENCACLPAPAVHQKCGVPACGEWVVSSWSECTVSCGGGVQLRSVLCGTTADSSQTQFVPDSLCPATKPATQQRCNECLCYPPACSSNQVFNRQSCRCECVRRQCGTFTILNPHTCECDPLYNCGSTISGANPGTPQSMLLVNFQPSATAPGPCEVNLTAPDPGYVIQLLVFVVLLNNTGLESSDTREYFQISEPGSSRRFPSTILSNKGIPYTTNGHSVVLALNLVHTEGHGYIVHYDMVPAV